MPDVTLFHNPSCSKSRAALELLESSGTQFETVNYLKNPPDRETLEHIVQCVGGDPAALVRDDAFARELGVDRLTLEDPSRVIELLLEHPRLLERPIVLNGSQGAIGRPLSNIELIL